MKRLVVCCDGTWNTPDQAEDGKPALTNVAKVALAVARMDGTGVEQRLYYRHGVGVHRGQRLRGGAFGFGLSANVLDAYSFVVKNYEDGDELYFFGFSRGAYTARSVVGLIRNAGILRRQYTDKITEAYALYRSRAAHPRGIEAQLFRSSYSSEARVRFIGVWDTVGACGIPLNGLRWVNVFNRRWQFHDTQLSTWVDSAFQALAVDEKRGPFRPAVWERRAGVSHQEIEQVWFSGCHCDIGGGGLDAGLSDIALCWMVRRATACGLVFHPAVLPASPTDHGTIPLDSGESVPVNPSPTGPIHESRKKFYRLLRPFERSIGTTDPAHEYAASSAAVRLKDGSYSPAALCRYLDEGPHQVIDVAQ